MAEQEQTLPAHILVAEFEDRPDSVNALKQCQRVIEESRDEPRKGLIVTRGYVSPPGFWDKNLASSFQFFGNKDFPLGLATVANCVVVMADVLGERLEERLRNALFTRGKSMTLPEKILSSLNQQRLARIQARQLDQSS